MAYRYRSPLTRKDITPQQHWLNRRQFVAGAGTAAIGAGFMSKAHAELGARPSHLSSDLPATSYEDITQYNNYYEFGTDKEDPARNAHRLTTQPWTIEIDGLVERPGTYTLAQLLDGMVIEERIYRFRCVETWAMVVPWAGFELADLLQKIGVKSEAKYVAFETAMRPNEMPGLRSSVIDWPYREGLRLDEAMHPLTIMATGLYDKPLPNQNGAPIRLVVPWKYGFKSIKSIVRISLSDTQPPTSWNMSNPREYGFYSNVNPLVDHPRWSQASERLVGGGLLAKRKPTLMFNGYESEVAPLYDGMDLAANY